MQYLMACLHISFNRPPTYRILLITSLIISISYDNASSLGGLSVSPGGLSISVGKITNVTQTPKNSYDISASKLKDRIPYFMDFFHDSFIDSTKRLMWGLRLSKMSFFHSNGRYDEKFGFGGLSISSQFKVIDNKWSRLAIGTSGGLARVSRGAAHCSGGELFYDCTNRELCFFTQTGISVFLFLSSDLGIYFTSLYQFIPIETDINFPFSSNTIFTVGLITSPPNKPLNKHKKIYD